MLAEIGDKLGKHTKVADIHGGDIADMHRRITELGRPVRANRILAIASKMFSLALGAEGRRDAAVAQRFSRQSMQGDRAQPRRGQGTVLLSVRADGDQRRLAQYHGGAADCVRLIMLTGCRPIEAMKAQWEEFDKEPGYWIKPSCAHQTAQDA